MFIGQLRLHRAASLITVAIKQLTTSTHQVRLAALLALSYTLRIIAYSCLAFLGVSWHALSARAVHAASDTE